MSRRDIEKARIRARLRQVLGPSLPEALARGDVTSYDVALHLMELIGMMDRPAAIVAAERFVRTFR